MSPTPQRPRWRRIRCVTSNRRIALITTIALAIIAVTGIAGHTWYESTLPPLTNAELARAIEHDEAGGGFMEGSLAHVSCRTLRRPAPSGATRECIERSIGNICIDPSTPSVYQLEIVVDGQDYREVSRSTLADGQCSVF
jgi:hypothetical protein